CGEFGGSGMFNAVKVGLMAGCVLAPLHASAQSATNLAVLKGLAPVSVLSNSPAGEAALAVNFTVTGGIQTGAIRQPTLLPFAEQQQQALAPPLLTQGNLQELTKSLGATVI